MRAHMNESPSSTTAKKSREKPTTSWVMSGCAEEAAWRAVDRWVLLPHAEGPRLGAIPSVYQQGTAEISQGPGSSSHRVGS